MDSLGTVITLALLIAGVAFAIREARKRYREMRQAWLDAAQQLGLSAKEGSLRIPALYGSIGGVEIAVTHHSSDNSRYIAFKATYPPLGLGLKIAKDNTLKKLFGQLVGSDDIDIDTSTADEQLRIDGNDEAAVKAFMTPQRMKVVSEMVARYPSTKITDTTISYRVPGALKTTDAIVTRVNALTETAAALRGSGLHRSMLSNTPVHDSPVATSPIHMGEHEDPTKESDAIVRPHPDDPPATPGSVAASTPAVSRPSRETAPPPPRRQSAPASNINAQDLAEEFFLGTRVSFVVEQAFDTEYAGQRIRWQGPVRSMRPYTSDHHFGETPGVKIVVMIAEVVHDLYGRTKIDIVAALPAGTPLIDRGDPVTITGTLDELDVPKRSIYLKNATLG